MQIYTRNIFYIMYYRIGYISVYILYIFYSTYSTYIRNEAIARFDGRVFGRVFYIFLLY